VSERGIKKKMTKFVSDVKHPRGKGRITAQLNARSVEKKKESSPEVGPASRCRTTEEG